MKYRLKVQVSKRKWKLGMVVYNSYNEAEVRQNELRSMHGINSIIVDELGNKLK